MAKKGTTKEVEQKVNPEAVFLKDDDGAAEGPELVKLLDDKGNLQADFAMPAQLLDEIAGEQMVDHMVGYQQSRTAWIAAKNVNDHKRREELFRQMKFSQVVIALLQRERPGARAIADDIMAVRVRNVQDNRRRALHEDEDSE